MSRLEGSDVFGRLQALTDAALVHLELEELLGPLLERVNELLATDTSAILLLDPARGDLVARAAVGIEEEVERGVRIPVGRGFAGRIAADRAPVVLDDVDHADVLNPLLREKGIKSLCGVPMIARDHVVGVLHVGSLTPRAFEDKDVELLQLAADRAAVAIDHARLFEAERAARARLERLQAVTDIALAHLELDDLLQVLLPRIREILDADTCAVLLLDEDGKDLVARAAVGIEEEVERGIRIPVGKGFAGRIAAERRPVILEDVDHADIVNPILREKRIKSMLGVPLVIRGAAIGVLHVGTLTHRQFHHEDTELLQLVADRVAVAIERAQLHEQVLLLDGLRVNFVAIASHELRTPAASVYGAIVTLAERADDLSADTNRQLLHIARDQAERLTLLLEQLLDLSRLDARRIRIDPKPIVLHSVLERIAADAVPTGTPLELEVPEDLAVVADPVALDRILSNLLVNAVRHGAPPIVLKVEQGRTHLRIAVKDHGAGVPDELRHRLFERFERGADATGSGLGLAIARAYAQAHGGDLVYDDAPTQFELVIPTSFDGAR
jgi:signal transduction histidine kinase